ncbi:hypothetical protein SCOR_05350 [Sulfidibacter corallicola]|uniref:Uncharacterized protein n=1 Tax=Sulfidibacter corallicola TaxID=2818388 RepID=A0A8A4TQG8_SULCO|nr:hypothetical protein [Sulfidibacter corallicola]QTD51800.1 hypothetical protein J3U87_04960 [Sulfidibacter corallicola]
MMADMASLARVLPPLPLLQRIFSKGTLHHALDLFRKGDEEGTWTYVMSYFGMSTSDIAFPDVFVQKVADRAAGLDPRESFATMLLFGYFLGKKDLPHVGLELMDRHLGLLRPVDRPDDLLAAIHRHPAALAPEWYDACLGGYIHLLVLAQRSHFAGALLEGHLELGRADYARPHFLVQKIQRFGRRFGYRTALDRISNLVSLRRETHWRLAGIALYEAALGLHRSPSREVIEYRNLEAQVCDIPGLNRPLERLLFLWPFIYCLISRKSAKTALTVWEVAAGMVGVNLSYACLPVSLVEDFRETGSQAALISCWQGLLHLHDRAEDADLLARLAS